MSFLGSGEIPRPMGTAFPTVVPYRVFKTADTAVAIAVGSERLWAAFCGAIGRPDLEQHPDYGTNGNRIRNRHTLEPLLEEEFCRHSTAEWTRRLQQAGIPASPVLNFKDVVEHPQTDERRMFPVVEHPVAGGVRVTGTPIKLSETPGSTGSPAPLLGQHTRQVLQTLLGISDAALSALSDAGVIHEAEIGSEQPPVG
jgi:CoA:oxalate CoA-transferase